MIMNNIGGNGGSLETTIVTVSCLSTSSSATAYYTDENGDISTKSIGYYGTKTEITICIPGFILIKSEKLDIINYDSMKYEYDLVNGSKTRGIAVFYKKEN